MLYPHLIRLRDPWQAEPLEAGRTRYRRVFQKPTGLDEPERVWLVIDGAGPGTVAFNGQPLGEIAPAGRLTFFDITPRLQVRNEIELQLAGPLGDVRLEIRLHSEPQ